MKTILLNKLTSLVLFLLFTFTQQIFAQSYSFTTDEEGWSARGAASNVSHDVINGYLLTSATDSPLININVPAGIASENIILRISIKNPTNADNIRLRYDITQAGGAAIELVGVVNIAPGSSDFISYYIPLTYPTGTPVDPATIDSDLFLNIRDNSTPKDNLTGGNIEIDFIEFISTEKSIFTFEAAGDPDGFDDTTRAQWKVESGSLVVNPTSVDVSKASIIANSAFTQDGDNTSYIHITYKNVSENNSSFRFSWITSTQAGSNFENATLMTNMTDFDTETFDLSTTNGGVWSGTISELALVFRPTITDVGADGFVYISSIEVSNSMTPTLSTKNITKDDASLRLFPNPVRDILNVYTTGKNISKIEVYSILGSKVLEVENSKSVNVSTLSSGLYISKIYGDNNGVSTKRFIKQ